MDVKWILPVGIWLAVLLCLYYLQVLIIHSPEELREARMQKSRSSTLKYCGLPWDRTSYQTTNPWLLIWKEAIKWPTKSLSMIKKILLPACRFIILASRTCLDSKLLWPLYHITRGWGSALWSTTLGNTDRILSARKVMRSPPSYVTITHSSRVLVFPPLA